MFIYFLFIKILLLGTITVEESNEDFVSSDSESSDEEEDPDRPKSGNDVVSNKEFDQ